MEYKIYRERQGPSLNPIALSRMIFPIGGAAQLAGQVIRPLRKFKRVGAGLNSEEWGTMFYRAVAMAEKALLLNLPAKIP